MLDTEMAPLIGFFFLQIVNCTNPQFLANVIEVVSGMEMWRNCGMSSLLDLVLFVSHLVA